MTQQTLQQLLEEACEETGGEVNFQNSYSGRGMYGEQCVGITGSFAACMHVLAHLIKDESRAVASEECDEDTRMEMNNKFDENVDKLFCFKQDSMGRDVIIYWEELSSIDSSEELSDLEG